MKHILPSQQNRLPTSGYQAGWSSLNTCSFDPEVFFLKMPSLKEGVSFKVPELEDLSRFVSMRGKFTKEAGGLGAGRPEPFLCQPVQMQEPHPCCGEPLPGQECPKQACGKYTAPYRAATQLGFAWVISGCLSLHNRTDGKTGTGQGNSHIIFKNKG